MKSTEPRKPVLEAVSCAALINFDIDLSQGFNPSDDSNCAGQNICTWYTVQLQLNLVKKHSKEFWPSVITFRLDGPPICVSPTVVERELQQHNIKSINQSINQSINVYLLSNH